MHNTELLKGWQLFVTLNPETPLEWLERDGEIIPLCDPEDRPPVPPSIGIWLGVLKTWKELGLPFKDLKPSTRASWIGQAPNDGGSVLAFLKEYRRIIEGAGPVLDRCRAIEALLRRPEFADTARSRSPKLATSWAVCDLAEATGVGGAIAEKLFDAGLVDADSVRRASDATLRSINGLGPKKLDAIRAALATPDGW